MPLFHRILYTTLNIQFNVWGADSLLVRQGMVLIKEAGHLLDINIWLHLSVIEHFTKRQQTLKVIPLK